jgi:hypothetical protein
MIGQFGRRWKCGKGSSLFAKFVRRRIVGRFDRRPTSAPQGCALPPKNRCDLVTNGRKVWERREAWPLEMTAFSACATDGAYSAHAIKLILDQCITRANVAISRSAPH